MLRWLPGIYQWPHMKLSLENLHEGKNHAKTITSCKSIFTWKILMNQMQTFRTFQAFHLNEIIIHSRVSPFILRVSGSLEDLSTFLYYFLICFDSPFCRSWSETITVFNAKFIPFLWMKSCGMWSMQILWFVLWVEFIDCEFEICGVCRVHGYYLLE